MTRSDKAVAVVPMTPEAVAEVIRDAGRPLHGVEIAVRLHGRREYQAHQAFSVIRDALAQGLIVRAGLKRVAGGAVYLYALGPLAAPSGSVAA